MRTTLSATALLAICLLAWSPVSATEVVHFPSVTLSADNKTGTPIWGHLGRPPGNGPFAAVVLMHGCNGVRQPIARWASLLNAAGYVTLVLDSFGPRSLFSVCSTGERIAAPHIRALDAFGALAFLQNQPDVDPGRIGVIGWSHGGIAALGATAKSGVSVRLRQRFATAVAFYPYCLADRSFELPVLILIGEADDWTPVGPCRALYDRSKDGNDTVELVVYPRASHAFDEVELEKGFEFEGAFGDRHWLVYDNDAHADSIKRVKAFLSRTLAR